jgi:SAM-dependent methyltransferase
MQPDEYAKLDQLDQRHWFYRGKRDIVRHWIDRLLPLKPDDLLIDAGTGTGVWPLEMSRRCRVIGLDDHAESVQLAAPRLEAVGGRVIQTPLDHVDLPTGCAAVVTMLDVLEHLDDDVAALAEMVRLVRPGGLIVITVPALRWLWSDWDVALHHRRRYHLPDLRKLVNRPDVNVEHLAYANTFALGPIALVRAWRRLVPPKPGAPRAEDSVPWGPVNRLLYETYVRPACWGWHLPVGVSLLAVLRKQEAD